MTLFGIGGRLRAGKDILAERLENEHGFVRLGMSDALNEALLTIDPWISTDVEVSGLWRRFVGWLFRTPLEMREFVRYSTHHREVGYVEAKKNPDVRRYLQLLGTEVGRNMVGKNVWVDIMRDKILALEAEGCDVVVTGIRFPNELALIEQLGGETVWVSRPSVEDAGQAHESESSVAAGDFRHIVLNDSTLASLEEKADLLLAD